MNNETLYLLVILGAIGLYRVLNLLYSLTLILVKEIKKNKRYREFEQKKRELLNKGEMHSWIEVTAPDSLKKIKVCEKTGWCPEREGFLSSAAIEGLKTADRLEQEYANFKKQRMEEIAAKNNLTIDGLESIYTDLLTIKREFNLKKINAFLAELKEKKNV